MSTELFVLRAMQAGLRLSDLDDLNYGFVLGMFIERANDNEEYNQVATQADFDRF